MLTLIEGLKFGATAAMGIFSGGALYINAVEHHSRRALSVEAQRQEWANSFNIGKRTMPSIGLIGVGCGTAVFFLDQTSDYKNFWLAGPSLFLIGGIFSVITMLPEINILLDEGVIDRKGEAWVRGAIDRWNYRHMFRTFVDGVGFFLYLYLAMKS